MTRIKLRACGIRCDLIHLHTVSRAQFHNGGIQAVHELTETERQFFFDLKVVKRVRLVAIHVEQSSCVLTHYSVVLS